MEQKDQYAIIISLTDDTNEIIQLTKSLEYTIQKTYIQHKNKPDVKTYIGSGKLDEIKTHLEESPDSIELIIVNGKLRPSQWFLLEKEFSLPVYDRIKLILMIFKKRAKRKEAQLQVQLAELEYEKPYVKELIHRSRSGEHPGLMAGGEYQVDDYFEMIKKQMKLIKQKLQKIEQDRLTQRKHRQQYGFYLVSLAGYTNAGKSTFLNMLTNEDIIAENRLFSTLSTTTRKIDEKIPILLTDTVGFIENLPSWIIKAFHSTLEEIIESDLILLVVDVSDPLSTIHKKIDVSLKELSELHVSSPILLIMNKKDLISENEYNKRADDIIQHTQFPPNDIIGLSSKNKKGMMDAVRSIIDHLPDLITLKITLPQSTEIHSFISLLFKKTYVISVTYDEQVHVTLKCNISLQKKIEHLCKTYHGIITR